MTNLTLDQFAGCLLGLAMGDALGAPYEGGFLERCLWRAIGRTPAGELRWTDDTQMTLDLACSLLATVELDQHDLAQRFAIGYHWNRGYGPGTARVLKAIRRGQEWQSAARAVYPFGSYGNGAAMRSPVLALFFPNNDEALLRVARASAQITHAHELGICGGLLMAMAAKALLLKQTPKQVLAQIAKLGLPAEYSTKLEITRQWLLESKTPTAREVVRMLGNGMTGPTSSVTALYISLRYIRQEFKPMIDFIITCGGDVDTIGAMAGALWGVRNGAQRLPSLKIERRAEIEMMARRIFDRVFI